MFARTEAYFHLLERNGTGRGYYPEPSKSVLLVHLDNLEARKLFGLHHNFQVCTGKFYLGSYITDDKSKHHWLKEST